MLARALPGVPVLVCADRYLAGRLAERQFGATVMHARRWLSAPAAGAGRRCAGRCRRRSRRARAAVAAGCASRSTPRGPRTRCSCRDRTKTSRAWPATFDRMPVFRVDDSLTGLCRASGRVAAPPRHARRRGCRHRAARAVLRRASRSRATTSSASCAFRITTGIRPRDLDRDSTRSAGDASADRRRHDREGCGALATSTGWAVLPMTVGHRAGRTCSASWLPANGCEASPRVCVRVERSQACLRLLPMRPCAPCGGALGAIVYRVDRFSSPHRARESGARVSLAVRARERAGVAAAMFAHFGSLLLELIKFGTLSRRADAARASRSKGRSACGRRISRAGRAVSSPVTSATGRFRRSLAAARPSRSPCWRGRSTIRGCTRCSSESARAPATPSSIGKARCAEVLRELPSNRGVAMLIDQHLHTGCGLRRLLQPPGRDDVCACGAGVAHRRAGDSGLRIAAARRPLSLDLRAPRAGRLRRHAGCGPRVHAALHRRAGDVRAPPSGAVAVDAPAMARPGTCSALNRLS